MEMEMEHSTYPTEIRLLARIQRRLASRSLSGALPSAQPGSVTTEETGLCPLAPVHVRPAVCAGSPETLVQGPRGLASGAGTASAGRPG